LELVDRRPSYGFAHEGLAVVAERQLDYPRAVSELGLASEANPGHRAIQLRLDFLRFKAAERLLSDARLHGAKGHLAAAADSYREAERYAPESLDVQLELAEVLVQIPDYPEAVRAYRKATRIDPENLQAYIQLAHALSLVGESAEARLVLERAAKLPGGEREALQAMRTLRSEGNRDNLDQTTSVEQSAAVDRAGLAALVMKQMPVLARAVRAKTKPPVLTDVYNSWASQQIQDVVALGLMDVFENHTFRPTMPVQRLDLARVGAQILRVMRQSGWLSERAHQQTVIADVPEFHLVYPDIRDVLRYEVMSLDPQQRFNPSEVVTGAQASATLGRLAALMSE
jgi:tetratricopeptide (TPR) repeat protein